MSLPIYYYVLGTPLGLLGLFRWGCWLVRRIPAVLYRPIIGGHRLSMTVVVPTYQEDPEVFAAAIESWLANGVDEVILVIDVSDTTCRAVAARYPVRVLVTDVPGKRDALRRGWNAARTELVALVDSDTVWAPDVADEVCRPFADPRVGGVGTRQAVYGSRGFLARITDMFLDHRYFDENASQSLLGKAVSCLSGRTAIYRRELLLEIEHDFMNETFWGVPCLSGDDKRLTTLILERGHLTYMQRSAMVWSTFPDTWRVFFRQRLRWARNTWRSDLRALSRRWVWRHPFLAYTMVDKAISSFTLLVGPAFMIYSIVARNWVFCGVLAAWWWISRSAKLLPHLRRRPSSFFYVPAYVAVSWLMALIKLQALLTVRKQRWLTRQVAVQDGEVVRTGPAGDIGAGAEAPEPAAPVPAMVPSAAGRAGHVVPGPRRPYGTGSHPDDQLRPAGPVPRPRPAPAITGPRLRPARVEQARPIVHGHPATQAPRPTPAPQPTPARRCTPAPRATSVPGPTPARWPAPAPVPGRHQIQPAGPAGSPPADAPVPAAAPEPVEVPRQRSGPVPVGWFQPVREPATRPRPPQPTDRPEMSA